MTIAELMAKYMEHADTYYVNAEKGEPTGEIECLRLAFRPMPLFPGLSRTRPAAAASPC
jgi:hypothetical protein